MACRDDKGAAPTDPGPNTLPGPRSFRKEFAGHFNGADIHYQAIAAETYIRDEKGEPVACFFTVAYLRSGIGEASSRPVAFVFNGGPGSSAQWLHMGALGPRRVEVPSDASNAGAAPYPIVDNPLSVLDACDLVFIDPIGTGYSRALAPKEDKDYWRIGDDARAIARFIETWISEQQRWNSPKYLIGESYGTARASLMADILLERHIALNGIVLISPVLDYQNSRPRAGDGGVLAYASFLPTYAAAAWHHGKVRREGRTLESFLDEVRLFARTRYALALIANNRLPAGERHQVAEEVAAFTGLDQSYVEQSKLRVPVDRFFKQLLRDRGLTLGRLDARYTSSEPECAGENADSDPTFDAIGAAFTAAMNAHLADLGVSMPRPYEAMADSILKSWNWLLEEKYPSGGGFLNVVPRLGRAMRRNQEMRVLAAMGYFDLATPFFGAENALTQFDLVQERIACTYFEVGHMIFVHEPSRVRLLNEVHRFVRCSTSGAV